MVTCLDMSRSFIIEFIRMYENEPCLWQVRSKDYHDRSKKNAAYQKLVEKLKEVDANATKDDVIRKINNLRSCVRKEKKKIFKSIKSGATADYVYKPKLWYFSLFSFLSGQNATQTSQLTVYSDEDDAAEQEYIYETDAISIHEKLEPEDTSESCGEGILIQSVASNRISSSPVYPSQNRKRDIRQVPAEDLQPPVDVIKKSRMDEDRFDVIGKGFAIKLRSLPQEQMLLAERLMNDVLFHAEMGFLTMSHSVVSEQDSSNFPKHFLPVSCDSSPAYNRTAMSSPCPITVENRKSDLL